MEHVSSVILLKDELIIQALLGRALRKNKATKSMSVWLTKGFKLPILEK